VAQLKGLVAHSKDSPAREQLDLDQQELRRREKTRSEFIRLRLESYMLSLVASDKHCDNLAFPTLGLLQKGEISHFQLLDFCKEGNLAFPTLGLLQRGKSRISNSRTSAKGGNLY